MKTLLQLVSTAVVVSCLLLGSCKRQQPPTASQPPPDEQAEQHEDADIQRDDEKPIVVVEGNAAWYEVPPDSLARRRAGAEELTAAHNRLPIGSRVRVTHLKNGRSVVVRITDRGIHDRRMKIDLCKEAAEQLNMVSEGVARVRIEVLPPDDRAPAASPIAKQR